MASAVQVSKCMKVCQTCKGPKCCQEGLGSWTCDNENDQPCSYCPDCGKSKKTLGQRFAESCGECGLERPDGIECFGIWLCPSCLKGYEETLKALETKED